jgi:beta-glucosidase
MGASFPNGFLWGAATAAYQVEGAVGEGERGETIWDRFSHTPGNISDGGTGDIACDHYHRYREDVASMRELGLGAYRFSVAWSRIFPAGGGPVNAQGLDFYQDLVEELLAAGIQPVATLYHWDLPQALQDSGGWASRDTINYFSDYAYTMFRHLGDRVKLWITHNEPWVAAFVGHEEGRHAPGIRDRGTAIQVSHHLLLSHAQAVEACRDGGRADGKIGITLNLHPVYPASDAEQDQAAARMADGQVNRWFLDPVFRGAYPPDMVEQYQRWNAAPQVQPEDLEKLQRSKIDFLGVNYYFRWIARCPRKAGRLYELEPPRGDVEVTDMGWEVFPEGLHAILTRLDREYGRPAIYITENGAAYPDPPPEGGGPIEDDDRIGYLRGHLRQARRAIQDGVDLRGYFLWSLMDNFEWAHGYSKRFGILRTDYATLRRQWKKSAFWYRDVVRSPEKHLG